MANYGELLLATAMGERRALDATERSVNKMAADYNRYVFCAKSHVHGLRASLAARKLAEDQLIAAPKAENANHPLASREAVEAIVDENIPKAMFDPEIIKKTYPDGVLPKGSVKPPNGILTIA
jgi:hypothetical protein